MTENDPTPVPDAAVQIAQEALNAAPADAYEYDRAWLTIAALADAGWLHDPDDPAEVAALRARLAGQRGVVNVAWRLLDQLTDGGDWPTYDEIARRLRTALDALPPTGGAR